MQLRNGWTGGQYSLFRALFGTYVLVHFVQLLPWGAEVFSSAGMLHDAGSSPFYRFFPNLLFVADAPWVVAIVLAIAAGGSVLLAIGYLDRFAALVLWYIWACLFTRNPLISNPSLPLVGWLLIAHALLPRAPYGSWEARGRSDPGGDWQIPPSIFAAAWIVMSVAYSYSGATKLASPSWLDGTALSRVLENPLARPSTARELVLSLPPAVLCVVSWGTLGLELCFAPLALFGRLRPILWGSMLGVHIGSMVVIDFTDLNVAMVLLHLFTFDPAWVQPRLADRPAMLFYDGSCGLCHRAVRFLLAEDRDGAAFGFAPLDSEVFRAMVNEAERKDLPDSLVLVTPDGRLHLRSRAVIGAGHALGGLWRVAAFVAGWLPGRLLDRLYDLVAASRYRLFRRPAEICPVVAPHLRRRFAFAESIVAHRETT